MVVVRDRVEWDGHVRDLGGHPLQLWGWGEVKAHGAWRPLRVRVIGADDATVGAAQILVRRLPFPFRSLSYVPRGPMLAEGADGSAVAEAIAAWARRAIAGIAISFEPQWPVGTPVRIKGSRISENDILLPRTLLIDLTQTEDELLARLSRTTRQGVRRSSRTDLVYREVTTDEDMQRCLDVYEETSRRAGFQLHDRSYYEQVYRDLGPNSALYAAFDGDDPVAFLWLAVSAATAFELYGGSNDHGRKLRANYSLKWLAITDSKRRGARTYDVNGLLNDGISDFKRSFSDHDDDVFVGTIDVPFSPVLYSLWTRLLPRAKSILRSIRSRRSGKPE
ncbi:peptidoglycan bridge formation glycyltransferase FemA/FemB family protein [Rarobacter faecitabidus]